MKKSTDKAAITGQILRLYWKHAWHYKHLVLGLFFSLPLGVLVYQFIPPLIIAGILDRLSKGAFTHHNLWHSFGPQLLLYASLSILGGVLIWRVIVLLIWKLENNVQRDLAEEAFAHLLSQSATFHSNRFGGSLVSQAGKLLSAYVRLADATIFDVIPLIWAFTFMAIILTPRAPWVVVVMFAISAGFIIIAVLITRRIRALNAIEATKENEQTGFLADAISNVLAVKSFAAVDREKTRYRGATNATRNAANNVMWASTKRDVGFSGMTAALDVGALTVAIASVVLFNAEIGTVFLVVSYTSNLVQRLWEFCQSTLRNYNRAIGDAQDMVTILGMTPSVQDPTHPEPSRINKGAIEFRHMDFTHPESQDDDGLFNDLMLTIKPGEKIGLVGRSGSGKTSLTKLLLRFHDIDSGEILIDGQNIAHITQDDLRRNIAYVPQEPLLFHRSIKENIAYGKPGATDEEIRDAARKANADEFIEKLAAGYETLVGERGVKLSGGQRQRIAIARAIIKDAPILLLDEATSALDSESELLIQSALWELMKNRTAIVIAHRLSTIQKMDRIVVLEDGDVIEQGSHAELIARKDGMYANLWTHQSGGFIEE